METMYDLIILGGGCAGLTAGIYAGRAKLRTLILERQQPGGQAATTEEIANYPGYVNITGPDLAQRMLEQAQSFGCEYVQSDVQKASLVGDTKEIATDAGTYRAHAVILATGAGPKKLGFEGEDQFRGRGVSYCATCDGFFFEGKDIFVVGGGYSAAEEALFLTRFGRKVTVLVRKDRFKCAKSIVDKVMAHPKIEVRFHTELERVFGDQLLRGAVLKNNETGETTAYHAPEGETFGVFIFVGYQPATQLFQGQVELDPEGCIVTNAQMETNVPGVFAAGDLRPKLLRQVVTATADGALAAVQAEKYIESFKETHGIREEAAEKPGHAPSGQPVQKGAEGVLTPDLRAQVSAVLEKLEHNVTLAAVLDPEDEKGKELEAFLREVSGLSERLKMVAVEKGKDQELEKRIHLERTPAVALLNEQGIYSGVKFSGIPSGHEFNSFIFALYNLAGPGQALEEDLRKRVEAITRETNIQVAISLSCHFCPEVVIAAQRLAILNPKIEAEMVDVSLFPELRQQYRLMSVPALLVNGKAVAFGAQSLEQIVSLLEKEG